MRRLAGGHTANPVSRSDWSAVCGLQARPLVRWHQRCRVTSNTTTTQAPSAQTAASDNEEEEHYKGLMSQLQRLSQDLEHLKTKNVQLVHSLQDLDEAVDDWELAPPDPEVITPEQDLATMNTYGLNDGYAAHAAGDAAEHYLPAGDAAYIEDEFHAWDGEGEAYDDVNGGYVDPPEHGDERPYRGPWPRQRLSIVFAAAEVAPFSKTGGLGDVMGALPAALAAQGHRVMVVSPRYLNPATEKRYQGVKDTGKTVKIVHGGGSHEVKFFYLRRDDVDYVFVDHPSYHRPGTPYGTSQGPFQDNMFRFALLSMAACEAPLMLPLPDYASEQYQMLLEAAQQAQAEQSVVMGKLVLPEPPATIYGQDLVIIANDWHTALVPVFLESRLRPWGVYPRARSILALHNLAHQGAFPAAAYQTLGLEAKWFNTFEWKDPKHKSTSINILKAGIVSADLLVTVSQAYAQEVISLPQEAGLEVLLRECMGRLLGIVNGVDTTTWDPATDTLIAANYGPDNLDGKAECKEELQELFKLPIREEVPLVGFIGRLDYQKGPDLLFDSLAELLDMGCQVVMLGSGAPDYEQRARDLQAQHRWAFSAHVGFDEKVAHQIMAGCDVLLMPSRFEPCGLNQMYAMKYGTVPVAHATGGLRDTIDDYNPFAKEPGQMGTGWTFSPASAPALLAAVKDAVRVFSEQPERWQLVMLQGMQQDFCWARAAEQYELVLQEIMLPEEALLEAQAAQAAA